MQLVLAEKPSVARDLARVLGVSGRGDGCIVGKGITITWCVGHLVELVEPSHYDAAWKRWSFDSLPMVPERFALRPREDSRDQWVKVERMLRDRDVREVINACDAGREGELIFRYAYELSGCRAPVRRLWVSSLTDVAIRQGWDNLRDGARYDDLADAARCRSEADWLVGLNATRAMTCLARRAGGDDLLSVGRVQTPTLAMIVERDLAIAAFVPETFWQVRADFRSGEATWRGTWFAPEVQDEKARKDDAPRAERLDSEEAAKALAAGVKGREGRVETASSRTKMEPPPLLYDLTSLQRRANQRYGFSADRTLELAQALYERHKVLTYPRTDARYLTPDQVPTLPGVVGALSTVAPYKTTAEALLAAPINPGRRVVDANEVGDHHAIIPTDRPVGTASLSVDEKRIFDLVARRLLAALSAHARIELAEIIVAVPLPEPVPGVQSPARFRAKGRVIAEAGWRAIDPPGRERDTLLPQLEEGAAAEVAESEVHEGQTRPPKPHDDASILRAMELAGNDLDDRDLARAMRSAGLGTPATRAAILKTLIARRYVVRQGKALNATDKGRALIAAIPVDELKSAVLTGRWEKRLSDIAEGRDGARDFMRDAIRRLGEVIDAIKTAEPPDATAFQRAVDTPALGECPACGQPVRERGRVYRCDTGRDCPFVVFNPMVKRNISSRMVKELLSNGRTKVVKGFKSKAGRTFSAGLEVKEDGSVGLFFPPRDDESPAGGISSSAPRSPAPSASPPASTGRRDPVGMRCPRCERGRLVKGRAAWGCNRFREGCHYLIEFEREGRPVSGQDAVARVESDRRAR